FTLQPGHILGLVGENGAGKSTLMNILGGVIPADEGAMQLDGTPYTPQSVSEAYAHGIAFIHQELNLFSNLSIAENIYIHNFPAAKRLGIPWIDNKRLRADTQSLLQTVNLNQSPNTLVEDLSTGERQLVEIAKALGLDARIILFDEPTTSLSTKEKEKLFDLIRSLRVKGISMIYISHALEDVLQLCDDIVVLRDGRLVEQGPRTQFTIQRLISAMVGRELDRIFPTRDSTRSDTILLDVKSLRHPEIVHDIHLRIHQGEILGIAGLMGSGRTELARILFGIDPCTDGEIHLAGRAISACSIQSRIQKGLAFLTEDRREEGLMMDASIQENIALAALPRYAATPVGGLSLPGLKKDIANMAQTVQLQSQNIHKQAVKTLSGGNQQKAVLAKWLLLNPTILILDEPTRGIDVGAKYEIYKTMNAIAAHGGSILFISSEIEELIGMCDRIMVMHKGEIKQTYNREHFHQETILAAALGEE
ncbi:ATP-binding cassette domain-containing protein, partial [bacterium]|nr:ATP-binding cassette domain-containing protein [bacterium]